MYWNLVTLALPLMMWPCHAAPSGTRSSKNALLQTGIKTLMGYRDLPLGEKGVVQDLGGGRVVPRYMLDLYSRFKDQDIVTGGGLANTARSISAEIGLVNGNSMFIFNLTAVDASEQILSSEVHIYRKKRRSDSPLTVTLYELAPYYITELGQSKLREGKSGWQVFSVTEAVRSCLATRRPIPHILAIGFSRPKAGGALKRLQLKSFIHHISRPFLLVHSNSNVNITEDHIHVRLTDDKNTYIDPESGKTEMFRKGTRVSPKQVVKNNRKTSEKQDNTAVTDTTSVEGSTKAQPVTGYKQEVLRRKLALQKKQNEARLKRSIYNNEIPEDPSEPLIPDQKSVNRKETTKRQKEFSMKDFDFKDQQRQQGREQYHLPGSQENRKKRRRKQKTKGVSKKTKSQQGSSRSTSELASPEEWGLVNYGEEETERQSHNRNVCARRKLVVDFTDIGWSNWVIAPKALESNYCGGSCPYPQSRNLPGLSNHATLQSLVRAVAINPEVPAPCCVPAEMSSLSLLYFDQYDNVVLKNYPNMLVQSCECR